MQSHTLIESQPKSNDALNPPPLNGHPRMGPVPEFLRPLPVLSSSNSNTTLKYKKAAILNHNLSQGLDTKYSNGHSYGKFDRSKFESSENGYGGAGKDLSASDSDENAQFLNKPGGFPKHFASMQGPYGIINNSMFLKKEEGKESEEVRHGRGRFLSSDLLSNGVSDKVNSSHVNYSGQFQANFIGHIASQNYLNRHVPGSSEQTLYFNNTMVNGHNDRAADNRDNSNLSREPSNQSQPSRSSPHHRATPPDQSNQENAQEDQQTNKKFKVPSKVPKESLLKYRILHKNNQRNLTQVSTELPSAPAQQQDLTSPGTTASSRPPSRNGSPCDSNFSSSSLSTAETSVPAVNNDAQFKRPVDGEHNSHTIQFKRPTPTEEPTSNNVQFKRPNDDPVQSNQVAEPTSTVINSEIQPNHFSKGVLIKLESGMIKHLEDLKTEDFVSSAEKSTRHRLEPSTVMKVEEKPGGASIVLTLCYGERKHQVEYESRVEQPYYVISKGWSSWRPAHTHHQYGLVCQQLLVGDTCISLCQKGAPAQPSPSKPTAAQAKAKRKELEKHFNLLTSKDRELNERKKRRWSAPDQIHEKTNKKTAKQTKLNEENDGDTVVSQSVTATVSHTVPTSAIKSNDHVATLPTSTIQNGGDQRVYQQDAFSNTAYYPYSSSTTFSSTAQSSHIQYLTHGSSTTTNLTHLITKPIVSHLPLSTQPGSDASFSMYPNKPSYLIPSLLPQSSSPSSNVPFQPTYASIASRNYSPQPQPQISYSRSSSYPIKFSPRPPTPGKNNFSNVGTLARSADSGTSAAVDFSQYSSNK